MTKTCKQGDTVGWNTSQGKTTGKVEKKLTHPTDIKSHHVNASRDDPQYQVVSDKSGKKAAHKPDALTKKKSA